MFYHPTWDSFSLVFPVFDNMALIHHFCWLQKWSISTLNQYYLCACIILFILAFLTIFAVITYHLNKLCGVWGRLIQKFDSIPSGCSKIWAWINGDSWYMVLAAKGENGETEVVNINGWKTCVLHCTVECLKVRLLYCDWGREPKRRVVK